MSKQRIRSIVLGLPVIALCAALTLPVLAAPPSGPVMPGFLARIWSSLTELITGSAPSADVPELPELRRVSAKAGGRFDPLGSSQSLLDPSTSDSQLLSFSPTLVPEDESGGTTVP